jgi:signal transduction histidine kinase
VQLVLQDNGKGFNPEHHGVGFGLVSMMERAERIGSKLTLTSKRGKGSKVIVNVQA